MEPSIFTDKAKIPDDFMLLEALGALYSAWKEIRDYVFRVYPKATEEWNSPGQKYGWSFRIKDKKRAIIYLLPRDKYFFVAFVFGAKATEEALASGINNAIKTTIESATVYAEGRGFRIDVRNEAIIEDVKKLTDIKLKY
jgi:hypothetical protein